jgi:hypothetical protein
MRKQVLTLTFALFALLLTTTLAAQLRTTPASPSAKVETTIGLTDVHIEYSRPGVKGRKIFAADGLVPFGEVWRTGANQATKITFGGAVMIGGEEVAAGSYAVLSKPSATEWEVMFFPYESGSWGSYVEKTPAVTAKVKSMASEGKVEAFTIDVQNYTMEGADIVMKWDDTMVAVPVKTNAKKQIMASIDRIMAGPGMNDYYNAASFLHENGDKQKALEYINKAVSMGGDNPRYWMVRRQGLILADLGMNKRAMAAFEMSTKLAEKAGNMDYVRMNKKSMMSLN